MKREYKLDDDDWYKSKLDYIDEVSLMCLFGGNKESQNKYKKEVRFLWKNRAIRKGIIKRRCKKIKLFIGCILLIFVIYKNIISW